MKGYENQKRVYTSSGHAPDYINSLGLTINHRQWLTYMSQHELDFLKMNDTDFDTFEWIERQHNFYMRRLNYRIRNNKPFWWSGPVISTITVNIDHHEGEFVRD